MGHSEPLFLYLCLFYFNVRLADKICRLWVSNCRSLLSEATAIPTEPPPMPQGSIPGSDGNFSVKLFQSSQLFYLLRPRLSFSFCFALSLCLFCLWWTRLANRKLSYQQIPVEKKSKVAVVSICGLEDLGHADL